MFGRVGLVGGGRGLVCESKRFIWLTPTNKGTRVCLCGDMAISRHGGRRRMLAGHSASTLKKATNRQKVGTPVVKLGKG